VRRALFSAPAMKRSTPLLDSPGVTSNTPARPSSGVRSRVTRTNLGAGATPLVGRRAELDALRDLVARERCVSVVGPAGVGKTRLARECAVRLLDDFMRAGGAWWVDVSRTRDESEIIAAVADTLDVEAHATLDALGPTLLVLDDATDCAREVAAVVERLARHAPEIRWLVTSRARLDTEREAILELGGLTLPIARLDPRSADSVQLFIERARAAHIGWSVDDSNAVASLVHALDGNALAIEVAAAWMKSMSIADALAQIATLSAPLSAERSHHRNHGLRAALSTAWAFATADEQRALAALARLDGGFDPDASEGLLGAPNARSVVNALVERGLLARCDDGRLEVSRAVREGLELGGSEGRGAGVAVPAGCVAVCARGTWFRTPDGPVVSISRWLALQNLLVKISDHRESAPDEPLSVEALITAGWPGERILPKAGATRVYTALSTLRRLGLRHVLLRRNGGYLLDPAIPILRITAGWSSDAR
jgi:hypothetical protein